MRTLIGRPPAHLDAEAKAEWRRIDRQCQAVGVMVADREILSLYCQQVGLKVRFTKAFEDKPEPTIMTESGYVQPNPLVGMINRASQLVAKYHKMLGITPTAKPSKKAAARDVAAALHESLQ